MLQFRTERFPSDLGARRSASTSLPMRSRHPEFMAFAVVLALLAQACSRSDTGPLESGREEVSALPGSGEVKPLDGAEEPAEVLADAAGPDGSGVEAPIGERVEGSRDPVQEDEPALARLELAGEDDPECLLDAELAHIDPTLGGFDTEVASSAATAVLKTLVKGMVAEPDPDELERVVAASFESGSLAPEETELRYSGDGLTVLQGTPEGDPSRFRGPAGLAAAMAELGAGFDGAEFQSKVKVVAVEELSASRVETEVMFLAMGTGEAGRVQLNTRWRVLWDVEESFQDPRLLRIDVEEFESKSLPGFWFQDCTTSAVQDRQTLEELADGVHGWWGRIDSGMGFSLYGDYSLALGDVDGDGLDDIYICQPGGLPNRLLRHGSDGTVVDISASAGVDLLDDCPSALIVDLDNDGNQDLVISTMLSITFWRGDGAGGFERAGLHGTDNTLSLSSADYDGDGLLDLYVCRYSKSTRGTGSGNTLYDSDDGKPNVLLRNMGEFVFQDVTESSGMGHNNTRFSFSGVWEDYDEDGDLDLYVANDFGRNNLYRNDSGRFRDVASDAGAEDMAAGMGAAWADYDLDGDMDLYVSNMFSSAGGRIVDKPEVQKIAGEDAIEPLTRFAKGNTLLRNQGDGTFEDVSFGAGITMGRWSWGAEFLDLNNDGWQDIAVPNGFITNTDSSDL